jgi:hypothetical protein
MATIETIEPIEATKPKEDFLASYIYITTDDILSVYDYFEDNEIFLKITNRNRMRIKNKIKRMTKKEQQKIHAKTLQDAFFFIRQMKERHEINDYKTYPAETMKMCMSIFLHKISLLVLYGEQYEIIENEPEGDNVYIYELKIFNECLEKKALELLRL